jgi:hypothetical protein
LETKFLKSKRKKKLRQEEKTEETTSKESNVGAFINTWQSWLKIERPAEDTSKVKRKSLIISSRII